MSLRWTTRAVLWSFLASYASWLAYESHQTNPLLYPPDSWGPWADKWGHALAYALLAIVLHCGLSHTRYPHSPKTTIQLAWLATVIFGATDELHQAWIPGRQMDPFDWVADSLGATLGLLLNELLAVRLSKQLPPCLQPRLQRFWPPLTSKL